MARPFSCLLSLALAIGSPAAAMAATIHGATNVAVLWVSGQPASLKNEEGEMRNRDRTFNPPYIVIPAGSTVRFPNDDPFYHSIYSVSKDDPFDIGYYGNGPGKSVPFDKPGVIEVHCHIHAYMHATIIVVDGPFAYASKGNYEIDNVAPGKVTLHTWSPDSGEKLISVDVPNADANVTQDVNR